MNVCEYLDVLVLTEYEYILTLIVLERAWGCNFELVTPVERAKIIKEEEKAIVDKSTGLNKVNEQVKQRTRIERMELVQKPTPAEVKNRAQSEWFNKVAMRVNNIATWQDLVKSWYKSNMSKFMQEVFDQWVIKNADQMTALDNDVYEWLKGRISTDVIISQFKWLALGVGQEILKAI